MAGDRTLVESHFIHSRQAAGSFTTMLKILPLLLILLMALHLIKPLGWPGMKKRGDFWKIAAGAIFAMLIIVIASHSGL